MRVVICRVYAESTETVCELPAWYVLARSLAHHVVGFYNVRLFPGEGIYILGSTLLDD